jgi:hypothetical protein
LRQQSHGHLAGIVLHHSLANRDHQGDVLRTVPSPVVVVEEVSVEGIPVVVIRQTVCHVCATTGINGG